MSEALPYQLKITKMLICELCKSIPLSSRDGLPELPKEFWGHRTTWRYLHSFLYNLQKKNFAKFPYHPNLESLEASAKSCPLCQLVLGQVDKAVNELQTRPSRPGNDPERPKQPTWNLWLTRRKFGDGFYVFTDCEDSQDFAFVSAIGICTNKGFEQLVLCLMDT